ncbi:DUF4307 domain-containing protein [Streptomyces sp. 7-21]|jgi:hypothetical protein|uniref:DUF4307 domain-containing protein n=1 Tax=Streptomyces sp. 7-21 TaxID=2802283 RepID=UPI00191E9DE5|nr:DUF4307 domain-containing protein [Streptomyces sp. 7-21]MBL1065795.1 DUF4307 domain-containing protein [Streptomyces sp. 7-21]
MANAGAGLPEGRYGRASASDRARTNRRLTITGCVLGAALLAFVAWAGVSYVAGEKVSGELTAFDITSDTRVEVSLAVRKPPGTVGVCTVRAQAEDGLEVGRADFRFPDEDGQIHRSVTLNTTQRATTAELLGCSEGS